MHVYKSVLRELHTPSKQSAGVQYVMESNVLDVNVLQNRVKNFEVIVLRECTDFGKERT